MSIPDNNRSIPTSALILGVAGLIPFVWGALTVMSDPAAQWGNNALGPRFVGPYVQLFYGAVILSFMSGVLWGFATKASGRRATAAYAFSVIPALWAFLMTGGGPVSAAINLIAGFAGLLLLDLQFARWDLTPGWWMQLRIPLSLIVIVCLSVGVVL